MELLGESSQLASRKPRESTRKPEARSKLTNDVVELANVDKRTVIGRRFRDICAAVVCDMGGIDHCSEARLQLIRRFSACAVLAEQMEAGLAKGELIDIQEHALLCSTLTRIVSRLGISRMPRDVTPTLAEFLEARSASKVEP